MCEVELVEVSLGGDVRGWFSGRARASGQPCAVGPPGNVSHRRPHRPNDLAATRRWIARQTATDVRRWHLLHQVHGAGVAVVTAATPVGAELTSVDAAVTTERDRPLVVQVADCVPVLLGGSQALAVAHAGRRGVALDVVGAAVEVAAAADRAAGGNGTLRAAIGPAIGGCCYEVPAVLQQELLAVAPDAAATTTWGTPSLDLRAGVRAQLTAHGVRDIEEIATCTRCDPDTRWFSHRADPATGRQLGLVARSREGAS